MGKFSILDNGKLSTYNSDDNASIVIVINEGCAFFIEGGKCLMFKKPAAELLREEEELEYFRLSLEDTMSEDEQ